MIARRVLFPCLLLGGMLASVIFPAAAEAQVAEAYSEIREEGIIFANVCELDTTPGDTTCPCKSVGKCSITQLLQVVVNISYLVFALSGTAALAVFIYGGVVWVTSAGSPDRVKSGRDAIAGAFIGLAIIFGAYVLINLVIGILKNGEPPTGTIEETIEPPAEVLILEDEIVP